MLAGVPTASCFPSLPNSHRIQTGRLSEFLTTSCRTHLSFMDPGLEGKLYADDYGLSLDSFSDLDPEDWLHGFRLSEDGKETGWPPSCTWDMLWIS